MKIQVAVGMALALLLVGCDREAVLYADLDERQANGVVSALMGNGIACRKTSGEEGRWTISLHEAEFASAMEILDRRGLPRRSYQGVSVAFKKTGMISSPTEERIRFMDAVAQDLSETLSQIDGVTDARVHVVLPENDPFAKNTRPSSAAVAIRHRTDSCVADYVPQIKSLVLNAIEGLTYDKVSVILFPDPQTRGR